jgi:hypothetical protein
LSDKNGLIVFIFTTLSIGTLCMCIAVGIALGAGWGFLTGGILIFVLAGIAGYEYRREYGEGSK